MTWLGHATVLLELDGARMLTDPVLRPGLMHLRRHAVVPEPAGDLDAVLVSHVHHDHLDRLTLRRLGRRSTAVVVPAGVERLVRGLGFGEIIELGVADTVTIAGVEIRAAPAWHAARRYPWSREHLALGFITQRIWFAGDTGLHPEMAALQGDVDVALLPVWGWGPSLGPGHLDPADAARVAGLVRPDVAIPIHWGTFLPIGLARRHGHLLVDPPRAFARQLADSAPGTRAVVLNPGESWTEVAPA